MWVGGIETFGGIGFFVTGNHTGIIDNIHKDFFNYTNFELILFYTRMFQ